ncbi:MAG: site-2 protease family protein, partial [Candidatus Babeliales bacterium]
MPKLLRIMYLIFALGFVIFFHELGHFASCKFFNIRTPVFSLGFGPALIKKQIGQTTFQISLLPLGGYVSINSADLQKASYTQKMIITLAGIFNNFLLSWFLLCMLFLLDYRRLFPALAQGTKTVMELIRKSFATIFGLLGKKSASQGQLSAFSIFHHDLQGFS